MKKNYRPGFGNNTFYLTDFEIGFHILIPIEKQSKTAYKTS